jgi:hypothetical protein
MKKRDLIEGIKLIKSRTEYNSRYDLSSRLNDIEDALSKFVEYNGDLNSELLKYIPISTVACFESFFRSTVKEIVDFGKPFSDRVADFNQSKNIKLDFDVVAAIQTKTLTVGEFVAHMLPYNNYNDINSNISTLIGADFSNELKEYRPASEFLDESIELDDFQERFSEILESIKRIFELRHIFCHEFATNLIIDKEQIISDFKNCKFFLEHTNRFIWHTLYPNEPIAQTDMNIAAYEKFELKNLELETLIKFIKAKSNNEDELEMFDDKLFDKSVEIWEKYRDSVANYKASFVEGGSLYPLIYGNALTSITEEKIESMQKEFEILLRKNNYA